MGPIRRGRASSFHGVSASVLSDVPNFDSKPTKVTDNVIASVSVVGEGSKDPDEERALARGDKGTS